MIISIRAQVSAGLCPGVTALPESTVAVLVAAQLARQWKHDTQHLTGKHTVSVVVEPVPGPAPVLELKVTSFPTEADRLIDLSRVNSMGQGIADWLGSVMTPPVDALAPLWAQLTQPAILVH